MKITTGTTSTSCWSNSKAWLTGTSSSLPSTVSYNAAVEESQQLTLLEMYMLNSDGDMETLLEIYLKDVQSEVWFI